MRLPSMAIEGHRMVGIGLGRPKMGLRVFGAERGGVGTWTRIAKKDVVGDVT